MNPEEIHRDATVVDTHNDLILLVDHFDQRDEPNHFGEFWLPELIAGGISVQVLPICLERQFQSEGGLRRALLLVERIHQLVEEHSNHLALCLDARDIQGAVRSGKIAIVIALEGAHAVGQDAALIRTMHRVGVRLASLTHHGRTMLADGSGLDDSSASHLTPEGVEVLAEMERLGMVFDVSHLGARALQDALERCTRPPIASHSACLALVENHRNLSDEHIIRIAELGGVVNVPAAIPHFIGPGQPTADRAVDHLEHLAELVGIEHVGVGPDFIDDYYLKVFGRWMAESAPEGPSLRAEVSRPSDMPKLTEAMVSRGFAEADIRAVLGENMMRVFQDVLGAPNGETLN